MKKYTTNTKDLAYLNNPIAGKFEYHLKNGDIVWHSDIQHDFFLHVDGKNHPGILPADAYFVLNIGWPVIDRLTNDQDQDFVSTLPITGGTLADIANKLVNHTF